MEDENTIEEQPTMEEKMDLLISQQDRILTQLMERETLDSQIKGLVKVILYLVILVLVFYIVKSLLTPLLSYL